MKKLLLTIISMLFVLAAYCPEQKHDPAQEFKTWLSGSPITPLNLKLAIEINGITAPEIVLAQSKLETGNYQSQLCLMHNNLFGMNFPRQRSTTAAGSTELGFASYKSWYDCVRDMKLFQDYYLSRGRDLTDYFSFLQSIGYAEDEQYIDKVKLLCSI